MKNKTKVVLSHMFGKKALGYRAFTITWTLLCCKVIIGEWIETLELTIAIVTGKFIFYGIYEYFHLGKVENGNV